MGRIGLRGDTGYQGPKGDRGIQGEKGDKGDKGGQGVIGSTPEITEAMVDSWVDRVFTKAMQVGYTINNQSQDYTLQSPDFDGRTIIRAIANGNQNITITIPPDDFVGRSIVIRKTSGAIGSILNLVEAIGVTIGPADATPIRRAGSSVTLVYIGSGVWDVFGELP